MKLPLVILTVALGVGLATSRADAGQCTQEIEKYQKEMSQSDAGMGPTQPTTVQNTDAADTGSKPKAGDVPGTEATAAMNQAVEGKATSQQDVQNQNQGQPTAADTPESTAPAAGPGSVGLQQARQLDQAGKEAECMAIMEKLKAAAQ
jgi:hypothetical protein